MRSSQLSYTPWGPLTLARASTGSEARRPDNVVPGPERIGSTPPAAYEQSWVGLKQQYQGIVPPVPRTEADFDPGAKFHIPGNTPYARYFLARILQFQFYKAACDMAGWTGPLHRCSFYGNKQVGQRLNAMLEMGASKPWPDALEAFTGSRQMSGQAMVEYFAPLKAWLDKQNAGKPQGW